jgi:Spy/CpxP family protein refolding chaperone
MRPSLTKKSLMISAVLLFAGAAVVFAHGGYGRGGYGGMMGYGPGYGGHMMGYGPGYGMGPGMMGYGPGYGYGPDGRGYGANLTEEQQAKLDAAREKFFTETETLRDQIQDKRFALGDELRKENPDTGKVTALQKELSQLEGEFDQKAIQHQLEVRKILPERARRGYGRGYGGGYCWQ